MGRNNRKVEASLTTTVGGVSKEVTTNNNRSTADIQLTEPRAVLIHILTSELQLVWNIQKYSISPMVLPKRLVSTLELADPDLVAGKQNNSRRLCQAMDIDCRP